VQFYFWNSNNGSDEIKEFTENADIYGERIKFKGIRRIFEGGQYAVSIHSVYMAFDGLCMYLIISRHLCRVEEKKTKSAVSFILSMFVVTIWSSANALEMASTDFSTKLFWANIQYFAYRYSPVTLLALCMQFNGYDEWIQKCKVLWLAVIPTIIIMLVDGIIFNGLSHKKLHFYETAHCFIVVL